MVTDNNSNDSNGNSGSGSDVPNEVDSVSRDLYGIPMSDGCSAREIRWAMSTFEVELFNIPVDQKTVYIETSVRAPHLIQDESDPTFFLHSENMRVEVSDAILDCLFPCSAIVVNGNYKCLVGNVLWLCIHTHTNTYTHTIEFHRKLSRR